MASATAEKTEFSLVLIVSTLGLLLNLLLMRLFVGALGGSVMPSKILASALVTIWNYLSRKKLDLFNKTAAPTAPVSLKRVGYMMFRKKD